MMAASNKIGTLQIGLPLRGKLQLLRSFAPHKKKEDDPFYGVTLSHNINISLSAYFSDDLQ